MKTVVLMVHLLSAISLVSLILLQSSEGGLGRAFGGGSLYRTKRGAERLVFGATIIAAVVFFVTSVVNLLVR